MAAKPIIFCPQCDLLILNESVCFHCGWQRPLSGSAPGTILWQTPLEGKLGEPYSMLAVSHGLLLVSLEVGQGYRAPQGLVVALDIATGKEEWRYSLPEGRVARTLAANEEWIWIGSEDTNPLGKPDNALLALNLKGEVAWQYPVPAHSLSAPTILGDRLFFTTNTRIGYIVDAQNGRLHHQVYNLPAWIPSPPTVGGDTFYIGSREASVQAIQVKDGHTFTLFRGERSEHWFAMPPAYHQGTIYAACWDKQLYAIDTSTRQLRWHVPLGRGISAPPVVGAHLYVGVKDTAGDKKPAYALHALNLETGETVWRFQVDRHIEAPASVMGGFVFVGSRNGRFYALDALIGTVHWEIETQGKIVTAPAIAGDILFFGTREGQITAVSWRKSEPSIELFSPGVYRAEGNWEMAGIASALVGEFALAAADFEQINQPYYAAQLYTQAEAWNQAGASYHQAERPYEAISAYQKVGNKAGEAGILLELKEFKAAAELYASLAMNTEAAMAFEKAGLMTQAANCYAQANQLERAIQIYQALHEPLPAARLYQQMGASDQAVTILQEAGLIIEAAKMLAENGRYADASQLLEQANQIEEAVTIWREREEWGAAAMVYERAKQWSKAAELYVRANNLKRAANLYQQDNQLSKAAELYIRLRASKQAIALYKQIQDAAEVARLAEQNKDWINAADAYLVMQPPRPLEAARCFTLAHQWDEAAKLYEDSQDLENAIQSWLKAEQWDKAVQLLLQANRQVEAAHLLEQNGRYEQAAEIWAKLSNLEKAIKLYHLVGNTEMILNLLESRGDWQRARELAHEFNEHEKEAQACVKLLESALPDAAFDLHMAAAQAFQRAAEMYESRSLKQSAEIAQLWEIATSYYEQVYEPKRAEECRQNINRLRHCPDIYVQITATHALVAEEWHSLTVKIANVGYGVAKAISVRVLSDNFEGRDLDTQKIQGLREGHELELELRVRPTREAVGSAVPLDFEVAYVRPDREQVTKKIKGQVPVRRPGSPITPIPHLLGMPTPTGGAAVQIYGDERTKLHALLINQFNEGELRTLCFKLEVDYDDLYPGGKSDKARELIVYMERHSRLAELLTLCQQERPNLPWIT